MELNEKLNPREEKIRLIGCFQNTFLKYYQTDDNSPNFPFAVKPRKLVGNDFQDLFETLEKDILKYCSTDDIDWFNNQFKGTFEFILEGIKVNEKVGRWECVRDLESYFEK